MSGSNKSKRKLETKTLVEKCKILCEIEKGMSNILSTWKKNSDKLFDALEKSSHSLKKLRGCDYEEVDQADGRDRIRKNV